MSTELARRIRAGRAYAGFSSHRDLAEAIGASGATIQRYETGKTAPDEERLARIAEACGLPITFFMGDEPQISAEAMANLVQRLERSVDQLNQAATILGDRALKEAALDEARRSQPRAAAPTRRRRNPRSA